MLRQKETIKPEYYTEKDVLTELAELRRDVSLKCISSLYFFYKHFWDVTSAEEYIDNWHIKVIADELQEVILRVARREPNPYDVIFNVPPGMSKSSLISQAAPIWAWLQDPSLVTISMSYDKLRAVDNSEKSKIIFKSQRFYEYFQEYFKLTFGHYIRLTKDNEMDWRNNFGGARYCNGIGGATGRHAHLILIDDPISAEQAESEAHRKRVNRFLSRTLPSRKINKKVTATILVMQRLHQDDPTQKALDSGKAIKLFCLPAKLSDHISPPELKTKYINGLLDPVRLDYETLDKQFKELREYAFAGQYMQTPAPEGGGKIKKEWFCFLDEGEVKENMIWDLWIDGAYTEDTKNDPTGLAVIGHDYINNRIVVKHATSVFKGMPEVLKFIPEYIKDHDIRLSGRIWIEPKASGLSMIQMLRQTVKNDVLKIVGHLVNGGKEVRINVAAPKVEASRVYLVRGNWNESFIDQLCNYPVARHDEYVDILGYATYYYLIAEH